MSIAFVKSTTGSATNTPTTTTAFAGSTTNGNLIVVTVGDDSATLTSVSGVTDNKGNTYTKITPTVANSASMSTWYAKNIVGGSSHTVAAAWNTGNTGRCVVIAQEFSCDAGSYLDLDTLKTHATGSSTTASSGASGVTTTAAQLVVGSAVHASTTSAFTLGAGYTNLGTVNVANAATAQESKVIASAAAQTATFTIAASRAWVAGVATFKMVSVTPGAKLATLIDAFDQVTLGTSLWNQTTGGSATMAYASTGATVNFPSSSTSSTVGKLESDVLYDLSASSGYIHVITTPSSSTSANGQLQLFLDANNWIRWGCEGGSLQAQRNISGSITVMATLTYNSVTHAYWKIEESGGTITWSTSPDGSTWTSQATWTNTITITNLLVLISGSCFQNETNPGVFKYNNFNTVPSVGGNTGAFFSMF